MRFYLLQHKRVTGNTIIVVRIWVWATALKDKLEEHNRQYFTTCSSSSLCPLKFVCAFPFWLWHYVQNIRCPKLSLANLFVCSLRRTGPVQLSGLQCAEKESNAGCYIGTVHFSFTHFF